MKGDWVRYRFNQPCLLCEHKGGCMYKGPLTDPISVLCLRISEGAARTVRDGFGWIHDIRNAPFKRRAKQGPARDPEPDPRIATMAAQAMADITRSDVQMVGHSLGVTANSLVRLGIGWIKNDGDRQINAWSFPMFDPLGRIIGIKLRNHAGQKWSIMGSLNGLFVPTGQSYADPIYIVEGPTESATMMDFGFDVIGRPGNTSGREMIVNFLGRRKAQHVVIFRNNDPAGSDAERLTIMGAKALATDIIKNHAALSLRTIWPPTTKDVRDWKNQGATRQMILELGQSAHAYRP